MSTNRRDRPDSSERNGNAGDADVTHSTEAGTSESDTDSDAGAGTEGERRRDVVVPRELYKIVTVFSTLIAIVAVVGGFILLDTATNRTLAAASDVNLPLAILAVGLIVLGAATYAFAARFRTGGMGSPNNDADEEPEDG